MNTPTLQPCNDCMNHEVEREMATATAAASAETRTEVSKWDRIAGLGAITFAVVVAATNLVVPSVPDWDASGAEVADWVRDNHTALAVTVVPYAFTVVALMRSEEPRGGR